MNINTFALNRYDECGSCCTVEWSEELGKYRLRANYCKCRHCEPCMRSKANLMAANLRSRLEVKPNGRYRFITLTLKHSHTPLRAQITRLYSSFKALRATKFWSRSQSGGAIILEVKWSPESKTWHPHLHIISEGNYVDKRDLSAAWHAVTGDSMIVDIRQLTAGKDAAHYLCKYVCKGTSNAVWADTSAAQEWISATKGLRVSGTFGSWRGYKLLARPAKVTDWVPVKSLNTLIALAAAGSIADQRIIELLRPPGAADGPSPKRPAPS
jgi:Replication protein